VELSGVLVLADPEHLHWAGGGAGEQDGTQRQRPQRLLVPDEGEERLREPSQQRVRQTVGGQTHGYVRRAPNGSPSPQATVLGEQQPILRAGIPLI
jgi:hypothetical protein